MYAGYLAYRLTQQSRNGAVGRGPEIKRGANILAGPYPKSFTDYVGQHQAKVQVMAAIHSANKRQAPLDHILLASGLPGIGKTTLGRLIAHLYGGGFVELGGTVTDRDVAAAVKAMEPGDVLFLDEIHRLVSRGKAKAEWLLTFLQDGELHLPTGVVSAPGITVIAATTDVEKLPETIIDRFPIKPVLTPYSVREAVAIGKVTAGSLGFGEDGLVMPEETGWLEDVARATDCNPRRMRQLMTAVRDIALSAPEECRSERGYDITVARQWNGLTEDGLTQPMQDYLVALAVNGGTVGAATIKALIAEQQSGLTEKALIQRGYIVVTGRGRELTDYGAERAQQLLDAIKTTITLNAQERVA